MPVTSKTSLLFNYVRNFFIKTSMKSEKLIFCGPYRLQSHNVRVSWQKFTKVSDKLTASTFEVENDTEDSGNMFLLNYGKCLLDYMASRPRKTIKSIVTAVITLKFALVFYTLRYLIFLLYDLQITI
jgi:hypothetical protein